MKLHIPYAVWQQMRVYVMACEPLEVTGIGSVEILSQDEAIVEEIFLPYQYVTIGYSRFERGEAARILIEYDEKHPNETSKLQFRWHSHGRGKPFWSPTDLEDIARWKGDQVFNLVTNADGESMARLDLFQPKRVENIPVEIIIDWPELDAETEQRYLAEVREKIPNVQMRENHLRRRSAQTAYQPPPAEGFFNVMKTCVQEILGG